MCYNLLLQRPSAHAKFFAGWRQQVPLTDRMWSRPDWPLDPPVSERIHVLRRRCLYSTGILYIAPSNGSRRGEWGKR